MTRIIAHAQEQPQPASSLPESRGSALGAYGATSSVGAAVAPAVGVAISQASPLLISSIGALLPLLGALALIGPLPPAAIQRPRSSQPSRPRRVAIVPPVIVFTVIAMAIAAEFTFVPLLRVAATPTLLALFGSGLAAVRILGGRLLDQHPAPSRLVLEVLVGVVVVLALIGTSDLEVVAVGAAVSGLGIGCLSTATLAMIPERSGPDALARGSMIWNIAYDADQAVGAIALGAVALLMQPSAVFLAAAALVAFAAVPAAAFDWRRARAGVPAVASMGAAPVASAGRRPEASLRQSGKSRPHAASPAMSLTGRLRRHPTTICSSSMRLAGSRRPADRQTIRTA